MYLCTCAFMLLCTWASASEPTNYMIVVTGGELLSGVYADGHTHFLTRTLRPLGLQCIGSMSVDDNEVDMKEALRFATGKAPLVIVTGGLGPTDNDITRQALSGYTGITLKEHPDVLKEMGRRFRTSPEKLRVNLRRQTRVPVRGTYLKNSNGTAVGLIFESADAVIVALPGPPRELQAMVHDELVPYLSRRFGTRLPGRSLTLRFVGLGQSQIDQTLKDHIPLAPDIAISSQFEGRRVDFTFTLSHDTPQDRVRLDELKQKIVAHLGDSIYAEDETSLEEHIIRGLEERSATLALAEVGSGGSLAAALSGTGGAQRVLAGAYIAGTDEKLRRLLGVSDDDWSKSASHAERLAAAAADATESQWAIAVGQRYRNESGANYVTVAFRSPDGRTETLQVRLRSSGELARRNLSTQIEDLFRRRLSLGLLAEK
ncbi:MAG: CinA family protein [Phycisphaerales bacterium]|nr:MAG: CinA family protein [Phycisphaerales bacterium]